MPVNRKGASGRRRSPRQNESDKRKPTTSLKDLLHRSNSSLSSRRTDVEKDGDFTFKRTSSQIEEPSSQSQSSNRNTAKKSKLDLSNIRKLTQDDMMTTPQIHRVQQIEPYQEHSTSLQLALPTSDTPIIRRNKEIRTKQGKDRRSSLSKRGKRVSSIGNGFNGVPHEQIPTSEYHKLLDRDLPDPHKMRQLLIWCSKKKFEEDKDRHIKRKNKLSNEELTALNIAKVIKDEIVRDLVDGKVNISWWNRRDERNEDVSSTQQDVKVMPNERNIKNQQVLEDLRNRLVELKQKTAEWEKGLSRPVEAVRPQLSLDELKSHLTQDANFIKVMDDSIVDEISLLHESTHNEISGNLELEVDTFNDYINKLKSASLIRTKFASLKSEKLNNVLDTTFDDNTIERIQASDMNKNIDTEQLLRGISRLDK